LQIHSLSDLRGTSDDKIPDAAMEGPIDGEKVSAVDDDFLTVDVSIEQFWLKWCV
jgi:hypothetical protein